MQKQIQGIALILFGILLALASSALEDMIIKRLLQQQPFILPIINFLRQVVSSYHNLHVLVYDNAIHNRQCAL